MKSSYRYKAALLAMAMAGSVLAGCSSEAQPAETSAAPAEASSQTEISETAETEQETEAIQTEAAQPTYTPIEDPDIEPPEGYMLIWHDEFDGDELDPANWAEEYHRPGWVNNELQTYVQDGENIFVEDGDLVIQPIRGENERGNPFYTSGRINTYHLQTFQYGRVEARIRVPEGQGFLPAFWMMSDDEAYGSWPKSGEIDIMEILGSDTDTLYGTLHYGNPHRQNQGIYDLPSGDFASEYHVFAIEWEPGEIRWYCDDECYYTTSYWYSAMDGQDPNPYPAPFNKPFYIILNVAVGGNWPGDPAEDTPFDERAQMRVDYVRVFRMDSYDENVTCPEPEIDLRDPDDSGNFIIDGDFTQTQALSADTAWQLLVNEGGAASESISDDSITVYISDEGTVDYSVQLVQAGIPLEQGESYTLSFDARSSESRQVNVGISGPDNGYIRYFGDETIDLTDAVQHYEFTFEMEESTDGNARLEFNMGNFGTTAEVCVTNVRLEQS